jgi:hypothetical protein
LNGTVTAQKTVFSVILNKGNNTVSSSRGSSHVVVGSRIDLGDVVKVQNGGYLALLHSSGGNLEITKGGTYNTELLVKMVAAKQTSLLNKYGMYLVNKINSDTNSEENLNITGAVERGNGDLISVHMPRTMDVFGDRAVITWDNSNEDRTFLVTVKNMFDEVISEKVVSDAIVELDFQDKDLRGNTLFIINVRDKENERFRSRDYGLKKLSPNDASIINNELNSLKSVSNEKEALNKLLIASFFEENELLIDASTYYNDAIAMEPKVDDYKNLYKLFLRRNAMMK